MSEPPRKPARSALTVRDMLVALGVLVVLVGLVGGVSRGCSFSPAGPTVDSAALPVVDAPAELRRLATFVPFPLRIPAVPAGWRSNSAEQDLVDPTDPARGRAVRVGYLTPEGRYLRLLQSDGTEEALLAAEVGAAAVAAQGTVDVAGLQFVVYRTEPDEPIWIGELDGVRVLITGSAGAPDYQALAGALVGGEQLPVG